MSEMYKGKSFSLKDFIGICNRAAGAMIGSGREMKLIDKNFRSHIMLAVTQVNGCKYCSYVHTKHALESGSSKEDLARLMEGDLDSVEPDQRAALVFAQHYADTLGEYDKSAYGRIVSCYGDDRARGILGVVKTIMMGNVHGGALSFLEDRFKGRKHSDSRLSTELGILFGIFVIMPYMLLKNRILGAR